MEIVLLGTGCPLPHDSRFGPATLALGGGAAVLIDCGSGVTQRLVQSGTTGAAVDALLLTHFHSDHLVDLYQLLVSAWHQGRDRPWRIFGPPGARTFVEATMALWDEERALRIAYEKRPSTLGLEVEVEEIAAGQVLAIGEMSVEVLEVDHRPVEPAFGFALTAGGLKVVVSGDTRPVESIERAAAGADLLLHEVFVHAAMQPIPGRRSAETVAAVAAYHSLSDQVGKLAARAGVKALAVTHIVPPDVDRATLLADLRADFAGPVIIGEDLMRIDLALKSVSHGPTRLAYTSQ